MYKSSTESLERRYSVRYAFNGLVPASLHLSNSVEISAVYLDVSQRGLGILSPQIPVEIGDILQLCIEGQAPIDMRVCWVRIPLQSLQNEQGLAMRLGLCTIRKQVDLLRSFAAFACVDQ